MRDEVKMNVIPLLLMLAGCVLINVGTWRISPSAGLIIAGILCILFGLIGRNG